MAKNVDKYWPAPPSLAFSWLPGAGQIPPAAQTLAANERITGVPASAHNIPFQYILPDLRDARQAAHLQGVPSNAFSAGGLAAQLQKHNNLRDILIQEAVNGR